MLNAHRLERRFFIYSGILAGSAPFFLLNFKNSFSPYKVTFLAKSKTLPQIKFNSSDAFWTSHQDPIAAALNKYFKKKGWLLSCNSYLLLDQQTVETTKIYKNKFYFSQYQKLWENLSDGKIKEEALIDYLSLKMSLV